jgi:hypothetical protein
MNRKNLVLLSVTTVIVAGVLVSIAFAQKDHAQAESCSTPGKTHVVTIENDRAVPSEITASRCDSLTITNKDDKTREIGFGNHDHHVAYDGVSEHILKKDENLRVILRQTGEFHFHDHFQEEVEASFTVRR